MKTYTIVAALSLAFAGSSYADGAEYSYPQPTTFSKTRAEVKAELAQAMASPAWRDSTSEAGTPEVAFVSQKTRAEVKAETLAAIASGELRWSQQEPYPNGPFVATTARAPAVLTAATR